MAPVAHAAHGLHAARSVRRTLERLGVFLLLGKPVTEAPVEALPELTPHAVPVLAQRVPRDGLVWRHLDIMRQREPIVVSAMRTLVCWQLGRKRSARVVSILR